MRYIDSFKHGFNTTNIENEILTLMPSRQEALSSFLDMLDRTMHTHFTYESDAIDFAKHPYTFFRERKGDCDDWAIFALWLLRRLYSDLESNLMIVFRKGEGHAICVVRDRDGNYHHISNWGYVGAYSDLDSVANGVFNDWKSWWVMTYNLSITSHKIKGE